MKKLKVIKAYYYDPKINPSEGMNVTEKLASQIVNGKLFYQGSYNNIFPDNYKKIRKRLKVTVRFGFKKYIKFYNENDTINLPSDLGKKDKIEGTKHSVKKHWLKRPEIIITLLGLVIAIISIPWWPNWWFQLKYHFENDIETKQSKIEDTNYSSNDVSIRVVLYGTKNLGDKSLLHLSPGYKNGIYSFKLTKADDFVIEKLPAEVLVVGNEINWEKEVNSEADWGNKQIVYSYTNIPDLIKLKYDNINLVKSDSGTKFEGVIIVYLEKNVNSLRLFFHINKLITNNCNFGEGWSLKKSFDILEYYKQFTNIKEIIRIPFNCELIKDKSFLIEDSSWVIYTTEDLYGIIDYEINSNVPYNIKTETQFNDHNLEPLEL